MTRNRKGEKEVRRLLDRGEFVRYDYIDPETGAAKEGGKVSLILRSRGKERHLFLIPVKDGRFLAVAKEERKARHAWDGEKAVRV